jgi:dienelactone hydrolase
MRPLGRAARALPVAALLAVTAAAPAVPCLPDALRPAALLAAPAPKALVDAWLKARKPEEREKAWAAIEAAPPLDLREVPALREQVLAGLARRGRRLGSGRGEWFDEEKDGWKGLHSTSGKGSKGLVLALHGGGLGSGDHGQAESAFAGAIGSLGFRGLYPEVLRKTEYGWTDPPETERWVLDLLRAARRTWDVDPNRVYVTGHSMGGYGTWTYGSVHADLFAAGAAFAGAPTVYWKPGRRDVEAEGVLDGCLPNLRNLPLFVYQSTDDRNVPCAANQCAAREMRKLREQDPDGWKFVYEEVSGRGHDFPEKGPLPGLQWMSQHVRDPRPRTVRWQPARAWKTTFYWVRWTDPWLGAVLDVAVDVPGNALDVKLTAPASADPKRTEAERSARLAALSFYVDERLLDPAHEVVVRVDGKERARAVPQPSLAVLVRSAEEREDANYVFACEVKAVQ